MATECYRHADASRPIRFDSPRRAGSNETLLHCGTHLPAEVPAFSFLVTSITRRTVRDLYLSIPLDRLIPTYPVPTLSDQWFQGYPFFCTSVPGVSIFKLLATEWYRHADALRAIPFDSPLRVDSNEALPDSGGHLPTEVSPFLPLLTSIALRTPQNIPYSIPLDWPVPTHPVPMLSDPWLKGYPNICT